MRLAHSDAAHKQQTPVYRRILHCEVHRILERGGLGFVLGLVVAEMKSVVTPRQPYIFKLAMPGPQLTARTDPCALAGDDLHSRAETDRALVIVCFIR